MDEPLPIPNLYCLVQERNLMQSARLYINFVYTLFVCINVVLVINMNIIIKFVILFLLVKLIFGDEQHNTEEWQRELLYSELYC